MRNNKNLINKYFDLFDKIPRHFFVLGVFFIAFLIIVSKVFSYTFTDHEFYQKKADIQQIGEVKVPVTRGSIFSLNDNKTLLATSVNLNDLAIDPTQIGDKKKLIGFLTDTIYRESCFGKSINKCKNNILKFIKKDDLENFSSEKNQIKQIITKKLVEKISQKYIRSVLLTQELDKNIAEKIIKLNLKGIYINEGNLYINPEEIENRKLVSEKIAPLISFPEETVFYLIRKREIKYIPLLNKLSINESSKLETFVKDEKNSIRKGYIKKENAISPFIILTPHPHRFYPENKIGSQIVGFVDKEGKGHYGVEGYFNEILKGEAGEIISRKDIRGITINPIDLDKGLIEREGAIIYTTINRNIQKNVEKILKDGVIKYNANKGSILIMNPQNGKIITMANYPTYDPNNPGDVYELEIVKNQNYRNPGNELIGKGVFVEDKVEGKDFYFNGKKILLRKASREELGNYELKKYKYKNDFGAGVYKNSIITDIYEPGSIMKAITMAIGIDSGEITRNTYYQNNGPIQIDEFPISDISRHCKGYHTFSWALNYSCNVGMVRIIQKVGKALLYNYLKDFGFGQPTEISLDGEISLPIKNYEKWSNAQLYTSSYGLGINVNQIQMGVAYSALVNGGLILRPQIIDKIDFRDNKIIKFKKEIVRRAITKKTSDIMKDILLNSIEKGVANKGKVEGYLLGGKTGTSQIAYKGGYEDGNMPGATNASFAGFGPVQDPKFVIIVKLVRPRTNNYGGLTSSYIFADTAEYLLNYYKIPKIKK